MPRLRTAVHGGVSVMTPVLPRARAGTDVSACLRNLLDDLVSADDHAQRIFWYYTPMALPFSRHIVPDLCVYDNMDELAAFRGAPPNLVRMEAELFRRADLVFTGGRSLYESKRRRHSSVHLFPSSVDAQHFAAARCARPDPADQRSIGRPRFGFFGVIDERMDVDLLAEVAALRPDWQFVMIGPVVKIDPTSLPRRDNIHWLGGKEYAALPDYFANWDVGLMPFAINEATRFISPTKTPEFLAAGLPVISTPIVDVVRPYGEKELVRIAAVPGEVAAHGDAILAEGRSIAWRRRVDRHLASMSWDQTWHAMRWLMDAELVGARGERAATITGAAASAQAG